MEQKRTVQSLLASDICERFSHLQTDDAQIGTTIPNFKALYEEGEYLIRNMKLEARRSELETGLSDSQVSSFEFQVSYCKYAWIDQLWKDEEYEKIGEMLLPYPPRTDSDLLAFYAKILFRLAEISEKYLSDFKMFWLTALYRHEIFVKLSPNKEDREKIRQSLIQKAEELIKKYADVGDISSGSALISWNVEKQAIKDIYALAGDKNDLAEMVCTPRFAREFGISEQIIHLIRENRAFFSDTEHYLLTGGYYSSAGKSLFHIDHEEYEKALASLPESGHAQAEHLGDAEFVAYCIERVHFAYGLYSLEKGENRFGQYFENAVSLFEKSKKYEKEFIDKALGSHHLDAMRRYEIALAEIHSKRPTKEIQDTLSLVMVRRAISMYNRHQMNSKGTEATILRALKLNPENELARITLKNMQIDIEMEEFVQAISKHKMNKACRIAAKSEHQEVKDEFFEFMERNLNHLEKEEDMDAHEKVMLLNDFFKWCARVDDSHSILYDIDAIIHELET